MEDIMFKYVSLTVDSIGSLWMYKCTHDADTLQAYLDQTASISLSQR